MNFGSMGLEFDDIEDDEIIQIMSPRDVEEYPKPQVMSKTLQTLYSKNIKNIIINSSNYDGKEYWKKLEKIRNKLVKKYDVTESCTLQKGPNDPSGAFGFVKLNYPQKGVISKQTDLLTSINKDLAEYGTLTSKTVIKKIIRNLERLEDLCSLIDSQVKKINKLFPENSTKFFTCKECTDGNILNYHMKMEFGKGRPLNKLLDGDLTDEDLKKIELQLLYIGKTLNENNIYHNDFAPRNIMIDMNHKGKISFHNNSIYKLEIKDTYIPKLIDYDFIGVKPLYITGYGDDINIYLNDMNTNNKTTMQELEDLWDKNIKELNKISGVKISKKGSEIIGGRSSRKKKPGSSLKKKLRRSLKKKSKKNSSPRKHKGINQQTGRLKQGYKYSGKKLKSGLSEIIKVKK